MSGEFAIVLDQVAVAYAKGLRLFTNEKNWALQNLSLQIMHGETLGVLGRNGAGKSTLLQLLAGMISPDRGHIVYDVGRVSLLALQVGFLGYLSGRENVILSAMFMGLEKEEIFAKLNQVIEFSELGEFIDQPVNTYSSGMKARLGFSVAFHVDPDVILVDEVIAVGDGVFKNKARIAMREKISQGKTAVIVSHDLNLIRQWCDRVIWLEGGKVIQSGPPDEVISAYQLKLGINEPRGKK